MVLVTYANSKGTGEPVQYGHLFTTLKFGDGRPVFVQEMIYHVHTEMRQILGGCPGWSETHWAHRSFCWFYHAATIWAGPWENVSYVICEQQRWMRRLTWAFVVRCLDSIISLRFYSRNFKTLASFCGCGGRFESGLVGNSQRHVLSCCGSFIIKTFNEVEGTF